MHVTACPMAGVLPPSRQGMLLQLSVVSYESLADGI